MASFTEKRRANPSCVSPTFFRILAHLQDMVPAYMSGREDLAEIAEYIAKKREKVNETESCAARRALASALLLVAFF
ncbi:hypothetical protein [Bradyrhizobium sp. USDA 4452]